jgi:putative endonuclease
MMKSKKNIGDKGEQIALDYLKLKGYQEIERNWRFGKYEIDLILKDHETLVFVEVKYRTESTDGKPIWFVSNQQKRNLLKAANRYILENGMDQEARFDIVAIQPNESSNAIEHLEDAFTPSVNQL